MNIITASIFLDFLLQLHPLLFKHECSSKIFLFLSFPATMPISELKDHGYEVHNIQLMQPTETSPVGLKLTKQQDPLQYVITAVAPGTKADLAGLKVNDWLIKIEDEDIRLLEFSEVSQDIRQLLTTAGLINMVIARKKTPFSSPSVKPAEKQKASAPSPKFESISRTQGGELSRSFDSLQSISFLSSTINTVIAHHGYHT